MRARFGLNEATAFLIIREEVKDLVSFNVWRS